MTIPFRKIKHQILELNKGKPYLVCLSGGSDSMGLAYFMQTIGINFVLIHFHHNTLSVDEEIYQFVCNSHEQYFADKKLIVVKNEDGFNLERRFEADAHDWRYTYIKSFINTNRYGRFVTGHHRDDLAELMLINFLTGRQRRIQYIGEDRYRPFLGIWKDDIRNILIKNGVKWHEDPLNKKTNNLRGSVRNNIISEIEKFTGVRNTITKTELVNKNILH